MTKNGLLSLMVASLLLLSTLLLYPNKSLGAIALDNSESFSNSFGFHGDTSITVSNFTVTGTNTYLIVVLNIVQNTSNYTPSATYNGTSLTLLTEQETSDAFIYTLYLVGPATGTHDLVVSGYAGNYFGTVIELASFTGVSQEAPEANAKGNDASSPYTLPITTITANDWIVGGGANQGNTVPLTDDASQTQIKNVAYRFDTSMSRKLVASSGSASLDYTAASNSMNWGIVAIKPASTAHTDTIYSATIYGATIY